MPLYYRFSSRAAEVSAQILSQAIRFHASDVFTLCIFNEISWVVWLLTPSAVFKCADALQGSRHSLYLFLSVLFLVSCAANGAATAETSPFRGRSQWACKRFRGPAVDRCNVCRGSRPHRERISDEGLIFECSPAPAQIPTQQTV